MNKFRIKIIELNNGEKQYVPQIFVKTGSFFGIPIFKWENVAGDLKPRNFFTCDSLYDSYSTEEEAISKAERYKKYLAEQFGNQTKTITYRKL